MSVEGKTVTCTGVEVRRDGDQFTFQPGEKAMWKLPAVNVAVDEAGNLLGGCPALGSDVEGKCPHARYETALYAINQAAKLQNLALSEGFVVSDEAGREMIGLVREGCACGARATMSRGADCPRMPAPAHEGGIAPSGVYPITDPAVRAEIDRMTGKTE